MKNLELIKCYMSRGNFWRALKNPRIAIYTLMYGLSSPEYFCSLLNVAPAEFSKYIKEVRGNKYFTANVLNCLRNYEKQIKKRGLTAGAISEAIGAILYAIIRCSRPQIVLETGVANGLSSAYILLALEKNAVGRLYSIDLGAEDGKIYENGYFTPTTGYAPVPNGKSSGWIIPEEIKHRWTFVSGRTSDMMPQVLDKIKEVDIFIHDSEHTYENMKWEYQTVWPYLKRGGLLISHDIDMNKAFFELCKEVNDRHYIYAKTIGIIVKSSGQEIARN